MVNYKMLNGLALALIGDSCYDLYIRKYLINKGLTKVDDLHKQATKYVSAKQQAKAIEYFVSHGLLTAEELEVVKRGRNSKSNQKRLNVDLTTYRHSTSFEALIGYLYLLDHEDRVIELMDEAIKVIEAEW